jgi:hypothetical protein
MSDERKKRRDESRGASVLLSFIVPRLSFFVKEAAAALRPPLRVSTEVRVLPTSSATFSSRR